jgi:hypothetical protein
MLPNTALWEHGSEFPFLSEPRGKGPDLPSNADLYGSGRDAIRALLQHGRDTFGWSTLWVPSYYCQDVLKDIVTDGLDIRTYPDSPLDDELDVIDLPLGAKGALLLLNPFGLRTRTRPGEFDRKGMWVIEDHTHDLWSPLARTSHADFGVASLRKSIPIPDGGILWSPMGHALPTSVKPTKRRMDASNSKLAAMVLKSLYLSGVNDCKPLSREFFVQGEAQIAAGAISGMPYSTQTILQGFNAEEWRTRRKRNFSVLVAALAEVPNLRILLPSSKEAVPFCVVLQLPIGSWRDQLRENLINAGVYPGIFWSLDDSRVVGIRPTDLAFSRRMLTVHCDGRYSEAHMLVVADVIKVAMNAIKTGTSNQAQMSVKSAK